VTINTVATSASGTVGEGTLVVGNATGFAVGQRVLIHQTRGTGAGAWEEHAIAGIDGTTFTLDSPLQRTYATGGANAAQVIVVAQYGNLTVAAGTTLTAPAWNGVTGGVLAVLATAPSTSRARSR